ncbi:MAG: tyrosine-protein phosphatase, partial [Proteobacteria bacterium]|nr:tyrosine-protein phosphatase [Pseudomonadota bacterium]
SRFLDHVATADHLPLMFHCAAGKDRTGFGAAVLLEVLGVPRHTIYADFDLTNQFLIRDMDALAEKYPDMQSLEVFHTMLSAHPDYLTTAYNALDEQWGGIKGYLADGLGVTPEKKAAIQALLLE